MISVCPGTVVTDVSITVSGGRVTGGVTEQVLPPGTVTEIVSVSVDAGGAVVGQVSSPGTVMETVSVSVTGGWGLAEHVSWPGTVIYTVSGGKVTGGWSEHSELVGVTEVLVEDEELVEGGFVGGSSCSGQSARASVQGEGLEGHAYRAVAIVGPQG
jgi:hypothetical protein